MRWVAKQSIVDPITLLPPLRQHLTIRATGINLPTLPGLSSEPKHIDIQDIVYCAPLIPPPITDPHPQPRDGVAALHIQRVGQV